MSFDLDQVAGDILDEVKDSLSNDWNTLDSFRKSQGRKLARQAALLAQLRLSGEVSDDDDLFEFLVEQFEDATRNFVQAVANLTILTLQNAWNSIVTVLWSAINKMLTGAGLSMMSVPSL